jgi:hypothetical protein
MYVYVWKDPQGAPIYVGLTKTTRRANPLNNGGRNWLTRQKLAEIGVHNVRVELRFVESIVAGQELERNLIAEYGRIQTGTGTLTNLKAGGEGTHSPSPEHREKLRQAMLSPSHPCRSLGALTTRKARMQAPDVRAKFVGGANPAKTPETRAKLKAKWADPEYRAARIAERTGVTKNLTAKARQTLAKNLAANPAMKGWGERNGKDPEFDKKRIEGIKAAQPKRAAKMRDPAALVQRKTRLKETMNSEEYKAKRAQFDTPEYREKLSAAKREYWAKKRMEKLTP